MTLLQVRDLHTSFALQNKIIHAVRGVSFSLNQKETLGIVGESGSGKSVMVKSLTRLLPPTSAFIKQGSVFYQGEDLLQKSEAALKKIRGQRISMIFQDPMSSLNPTMKVGKQIMEGYLLHHPHVSKQIAQNKTIELLEEVGISDPVSRLNQYPHELSGGIRQRVMIAIAIVCSPDILIADEPTTSLDVTIQAQILRLLKTIQQQKGMSIMLITHDLSIVAGFCERVLVMYGGQIIESAPTRELFANPLHPYTKRLLASIPRLDTSSDHTLYSIQGSPPDLSQIIKGCSFKERCPHAKELCYKTNPPHELAIDDHYVSCWLQDNQRVT